MCSTKKQLDYEVRVKKVWCDQKLHLFHDMSIWRNMEQSKLHQFLLNEICVVPNND
jgi:hypothetical protein